MFDAMFEQHLIFVNSTYDQFCPLAKQQWKSRYRVGLVVTYVAILVSGWKMGLDVEGDDYSRLVGGRW